MYSLLRSTNTGSVAFAENFANRCSWATPLVGSQHSYLVYYWSSKLLLIEKAGFQFALAPCQVIDR